MQKVSSLGQVSFRRDSNAGTESDTAQSRNSFESSQFHSDTTAGLTGNAWFGAQSSLFSYLDALKNKPHHLMYLFYYAFLLVSSIPLVCTDVPNAFCILFVVVFLCVCMCVCECVAVAFCYARVKVYLVHVLNILSLTHLLCCM